MRILVLQHIACEPPAVYEDVMVERGCEIYRVELDEGETCRAGTCSTASSRWAARWARTTRTSTRG